MENKNRFQLKNMFKKEFVLSCLKWFFYSFIWLGILIFVIDIVTKHIVQANLIEGEFVEIIPNFFYFKLIYNRGAGYGLINNLEPDWLRRVLLIGISLIMSTAFIVFYIIKYKKLKITWKIALMVLTAGAVGNLIDRVFYPDGAVIDFLVIKINDFVPFGSFNIADSALVLGIIYIIILFIIDEVNSNRKINKKLNENISAENSQNSKNIEDSQGFSSKEETKSEVKEDEKNTD